jgi:hypothetical protein
MDFGALSIDHEVLTQNHGWKYLKNVTFDDSIATLDINTNNICFMYPSEINVQEHTGQVVNIQNERINVLGTGLVGLIDISHESQHNIVYLQHIEKTKEYMFKTTAACSPSSSGLPSITVSENAKILDKFAINMTLQGKHAVIYTSTYMNNNIYELEYFDCDVKYKSIDEGNDIVNLQKFYSNVVYIGFDTSNVTPIYTRRYGKPCWVVLTHPPADTRARGQCHPMNSC